MFLTSFILALQVVVADKVIKLGISPITSFILTLRIVLVATLVISGIPSSVSLILALYTSLVTTSVFTTSLGLLKSTGAGTNLPTSNLCTLLLKLLKLLRTLFNLSKSTFICVRSLFRPKMMYRLLLHF